ncbi:MAG: outer membrane protein assembly factor BamD [Candidatus Omnitrophica bacterium]|nr:outer membrane protein assembly factor BamD [Candidatus Omnitrophota bacterium]
MTRREHFVIGLIFAAVFCFLCAHFNPALLFTPTVTTGGDLGSHFYPAQYLRDTLLPQFKLHGWSQAHYCGYPIFLFYFPSSFLLIMLVSLALPLEIAFKLVTASSVFLLPPAAYYLLRKLRYEFPVPVTGALFSLVFLFNSGNSMWGGNVYSTLAGEFSYQMGFAFLCLFLGSLIDTITGFRAAIKNAFLLALTGLTHGYAFVFAFAMAPYFLLAAPRGTLLRRAAYLFRVYAWGVGLMAFWFLPMLVNQPWTIPFRFAWTFTLQELLPFPMAALAALTAVAGLARIFRLPLAAREFLDGRFFLLGYAALAGAFLFLIGFRLGVVDIRFVPFVQFFLVLMAAAAFWAFAGFVRDRALGVILLGAAVLLAVAITSPASADWFRWNYSGFEAKAGWKQFQGINEFLKGDFAAPRVAVEPSESYESFGTPRAFESLPLFSGRQTLEGLYMQSSISSPFVFYQQAEMSPSAPCPYTDYHYPRFDFPKALAHLRLFNVRDLIVTSEKAKQACRQTPGLKLKKTDGKIEIYELPDPENRYVTPLRYRPVLAGPDWKRQGYEWFRRAEWLEVPLIFNANAEDRRSLLSESPEFRSWDRVPKIPAEGNLKVEETVRDEKIRFKVSRTGVPVLIKISYHPNWRVTGARKIFFASPSFMIVYPERETVELEFRRSRIDLAGITITAAALIFALSALLRRRAPDPRAWKADLFLSRWHGPILAGLAAFLLLSFGAGALVYLKSPEIVYNRAMRLYDQRRYGEARRVFSEFSARYPRFSLADEALFFHAMAAYLTGDHKAAAAGYREFSRLFFDSVYLPEALYHWGLSCQALGQRNKMARIFTRLAREFPGSEWAEPGRKIMAGEGAAA